MKTGIANAIAVLATFVYCVAIAVIAAAVTLAPPAHAAPGCAAIGSNPATMSQYNDCVKAAGAWCRDLGVGPPIIGPLAMHQTCFYPDGGRDECDWTGNTWNHQTASVHCDYFPPGQ